MRIELKCVCWRGVWRSKERTTKEKKEQTQKIWEGKSEKRADRIMRKEPIELWVKARKRWRQRKLTDILKKSNFINDRSMTIIIK